MSASGNEMQRKRPIFVRSRVAKPLEEKEEDKLAEQLQMELDKAIAAGSVLGEVVVPKFEFKVKPAEKNGFWVFWDFDNTFTVLGTSRIGKGFSGGDRFKVAKLRNNMTNSLKNLDKDYFVAEVVGFGDLNAFNADEFCKLTKNQFKLGHTPRRCVYCPKCIEKGYNKIVPESRFQRLTDRADRLILEAMFAFTKDIPAPSNMVVVSGDADFATPIRQLRDDGYRVGVSALEDSKEELNQSGEFLFLAEAFLKGGKPT